MRIREHIISLLVVVFSLHCTGLVHTATTPTKDNKQPLWNTTWTDKLKHDLLLNYDKFARPTQHFNTTTVNFNLVVKHVQVDDISSVMTVNAWCYMKWSDDKMKWDESAYGGLAVLHLADHEIWQPDIVLYNSVQGSVDHYGNTHCLAYPEGKVLWVPPAQFSAFCELDMQRWPFDTQVCSLKLGSWTYNGEQIDLQSDQDVSVEMELSSEWILKSVEKRRNEVYYSCCPEPYQDITYTFTLKRRSPSYHAVVLTPAIVITILTLCVFWLPPSSCEKFLITGFNAIFTSLFIVYFSQKIPMMSAHTPLIVLFYCYSLLLASLSIIVSVVTHNLSRVPQARPIPSVLNRFLNGNLGRLLAVSRTKSGHQLQPDRSCELTSRQFDSESLNDERGMLTPADTCRDWTRLATGIDRAAFLIYLMIFAIMILAIVL